MRLVTFLKQVTTAIELYHYSSSGLRQKLGHDHRASPISQAECTSRDIIPLKFVSADPPTLDSLSVMAYRIALLALSWLRNLCGLARLLSLAMNQPQCQGYASVHGSISSPVTPSEKCTSIWLMALAEKSAMTLVFSSVPSLKDGSWVLFQQHVRTLDTQLDSMIFGSVYCRPVQPTPSALSYDLWKHSRFTA